VVFAVALSMVNADPRSIATTGLPATSAIAADSPIFFRVET
jgi:hypothetical protein